MTPHHLLTLAPLIVVLACAAVTDWRTRRIPNWLTFSLILSGLVQSVIGSHTVPPSAALLGLLLGAGLTFALFALGAMGGGDVKMFAGVGVWLGPGPTFGVFAVSALIGMVIVLAQAASHGRLRQLFRNSAVIAVNLAHVNRFGVDHVAEVGRAHSTMEWKIPKAVPVLLAVLTLVGLSWVGR